MPQRFLRPQITNSDRWNSVGWPSQSLYVRLITLVDDYGRYDGRTAVIWAHCFAVWNDKHPQENITAQQVDRMLQELAATRLIVVYEVQDKKIIQLEQWCERVREGVVEKWPANPNSNEITGELPKSPKVAATSCKILPSSPSPSPSPSPKGRISPLKLSQRISYEKELTRIGTELSKLGRLKDYDEGSKSYKRIQELTERQTELRTALGVKA